MSAPSNLFVHPTLHSVVAVGHTLAPSQNGPLAEFAASLHDQPAGPLTSGVPAACEPPLALT